MAAPRVRAPHVRLGGGKKRLGAKVLPGLYSFMADGKQGVNPFISAVYRFLYIYIKKKNSIRFLNIDLLSFWLFYTFPRRRSAPQTI